jgi:two-component system CheB/CheR fusion protein
MQDPPQPPPAPITVPSGLDFPVVGIGASAGGIAAVRALLEGLPALPGMAFVVVLHLSPAHESHAAAVLQAATAMPVRQVTGATRIERDRVYVIPPTSDLAMVDGMLVTREADRGRVGTAVVDLFFRTLADAHRERAVGIVLSGTGSDGALGAGRLQEKGGLVIAQDPADAEHAGMPEAAIAGGHVDIVLPVAEIPDRLLALWNNARQIELPGGGEAGLAVAEPQAPQAADQTLKEILLLLQRRTGHDFRHYKRATVLRRIERRLQVNAVPDLAAYREILESTASEPRALLEDMLIGVTQFFRDRTVFEAVEREIVPRVFDAASADEPLRAWVAGCSTGEEAYSLAMLLAEEAARRTPVPGVTLFATDIDDRSIVHARDGRYGDGIAVDVSPARLRQFFTRPSEGGHAVTKALRESIIFAQHNLLRDPPFSKVDLICCRNLLIYLDRAAQADVLRMFHFALKPGGYLVLGSSETVDSTDERLFEPIDKVLRLYQAAPKARRLVRPMPAFAPGGPVALLPAPARAEGAAPARPKTARAQTLADLHARLLDEHGPPSVVVSGEGEILHLSGRAGAFLQWSEGEPSHNVVVAAHPTLRDELRAVLHEALRTADRVESQPVRMLRDGAATTVRIAAQSGDRAAWPAPVVLVSFDERPLPAGSGADGATEPDDPSVARLERELARRTEQLQALIEQHDTSAEELKASNEELQAINEELRSATEELETSKEELQSVNEELLTVNHELKAKVDETGEINDDLHNLIGAIDVATVFVDPEMRIKRFTPAAGAIFSLIPADLGRPLSDITHKLDHEDLVADAKAVYTSLRGFDREIPSVDGRWFLARFLPYRTAQDRIGGVVLNFLDVTGRREAETAAALAQERLRLVGDAIGDVAVLTLDADGRFDGWSPGCQRLFGYTEQEAIGQPVDLVFTLADRVAGVPAEEMRRAREDGRADDDRWLVRKDGSRVFVAGVMTALEADGLRGYAKVCRDIGADSARHERELAAAHRSEREAMAESALKSEFLAVMSHELKHPLNLINVNAQLLTTLPEAQALPKVMRVARTILRTVTGQARIIDDLLDLSRIDSGKLTFNRAPVLVVEALQSCLTWALAEAREKGLRLYTEGFDEPLVVEGDATRIEQIAWNLLSNALKYNRPGGSVVVRLVRAGAIAQLEVSDSGRGIDPAFLPHVFQMFRQAEQATTRQYGGLGIGLALVRSLVLLHGGTVEATSEGLGKGATFFVRLPLDGATPTTPLEAPSQPAGTLAGKRLLLVDDAPDTLETFALLLETEGATVVRAESGAAALAAVDAATFDLVLSDIGMPEMDGYALVEALRRRPDTATVPCIALTGYGRREDVERALASGFDTHLDKPVDFARMLRLVADVLAARGSGGPNPDRTD